MTLHEILSFAQNQRLAVEASVASEGGPQAAVVGVVVSDAFEIFFDTLGTSRKAKNLRHDPRTALVLGWDLGEGRTLQIEGIADEPEDEDLERLQRLYFERFPDGIERQSWPHISYFRVRPSWLRFSDFSGTEPELTELDAIALKQFLVPSH